MPRYKADRDLALQLQAVRAFASRLQKAKPLKMERLDITTESRPHGPSGEQAAAFDQLSKAKRTLFDAAHYSERLQWLKARTHTQDDATARLIKELERVMSMGSVRTIGAAPNNNALRDLAKSFPHCSAVTEHVYRRAVLARLVPHAPLKLPPMLLSGPPGVGKTAFAQRLAEVMGVPLINVDVSTLDASFTLTGLDAGYSTGKPGMVWDALQHECMSPIIVLDEVDKMPTTRQSGLGFLLGLLEPSTACRFTDTFMGVPIDASQIQWIATCNEPEQVDAAVRSRFHEFWVDLPTREQMPAVIQSVYQSLRLSEPWGMAFTSRISPEVMSALSALAPRDIWKSLSDACASAAMEGRCSLMEKDLQLGSTLGTSRKMGFI